LRRGWGNELLVLNGVLIGVAMGVEGCAGGYSKSRKGGVPFSAQSPNENTTLNYSLFHNFRFNRPINFNKFGSRNHYAIIQARINYRYFTV
jgi:hypothetical protein